MSIRPKTKDAANLGIRDVVRAWLLQLFPSSGKPLESRSAEPDVMALAAQMAEWLQELVDSCGAGIQGGPPVVNLARWQTESGQRILVSTSANALSVVIAQNSISVYKIPACSFTSLDREESRSRLKLKVVLDDARGWTTDDVLISVDEIRAIVKSAFRTMLMASAQDGIRDQTAQPFSLPSLDRSIGQRVDELVHERQQLAQKIVDQNEQIQRDIARDIHDEVIGDLMLVISSMDATSQASAAIRERLLNTVSTLRQVCCQLAPRDLSDWGLVTVIEDLLEKTGALCSTEFLFESASLPSLPPEVELHIFRIVQECINNVVKHSNASQVRISIRDTDNFLLVEVADNGSGIKQNAGKTSSKDGGSGISIIRERAELIASHRPCDLQINSSPESGTAVLLTVGKFDMRKGQSETNNQP